MSMASFSQLSHIHPSYQVLYFNISYFLQYSSRVRVVVFVWGFLSRERSLQTKQHAKHKAIAHVLLQYLKLQLLPRKHWYNALGCYVQSYTPVLPKKQAEKGKKFLLCLHCRAIMAPYQDTMHIPDLTTKQTQKYKRNSLSLMLQTVLATGKKFGYNC